MARIFTQRAWTSCAVGADGIGMNASKAWGRAVVALWFVWSLAACAGLPGETSASFQRALELEAAAGDDGPGLARAAVAYAQAAERGHAAAMNNLGLLFHRGRGVARDDGEARAWFERSIVAGYAGARVNLGLLCFYGLGGERDLERARELWRVAAEHGDGRAAALLGSWHYEGAAGTAVDRAEAVRWYAIAAPAGETTAQHRLGLCLLRGDGVDADAEAGVAWLQRAAAQGSAHAQRDLALCLQRGTGVAKDPAVAREWLARAAANGDPIARSKLGGVTSEPAAPARD